METAIIFYRFCLSLRNLMESVERSKIVLFALLLLSIWISPAGAIDSDITRRTLIGIREVNVVVEELNSNVQRYATKFGLTRSEIKAETEGILRGVGIMPLTYDQWLKTPGRPFLYISICTHEFEKYWYAYGISLELKQLVYLEKDTSVRTIADTWGINMTGIASIGKLKVIKEGLNVLLQKFIEAHLAANSKEK